MQLSYDKTPDSTTGQDTWANLDAADTNYGNSVDMHVYQTPTSHDGIAFIKFPNLPSKATVIVSATLQLYMSYNDGSPSITVERVTSADWDEDTLTWNNKPTGSGTLFAGAMVGEPGSYSLDVDQALLMCQTNYGMRLYTTAVTATNWYTSNHATAGYRPRLTMKYHVPSSQVIFIM